MSQIRTPSETQTALGRYAETFDALAAQRPSGAHRERYETHRLHYRRVAEYLYSRLGDLDIALAALLHGWPETWQPTGNLPAEILAELPVAHVTLVRAILQGRSLFRQVEPGPAADHDLDKLLSKLQHPGSVLLFLAEQLDHAVPGADFFDWTRGFREAPSVYRGPPGVPSLSPERVDYLERVVARTADFWGCRLERWTAENIVVRQREPELFDRVCELARDDESARDLEARLTRVLADSGVARHVKSVRWSWRHAARMASTLGRFHHGDQAGHLLECGAIDVVCATGRRCYTVMRELHSIFSYRRDRLLDWVGRPSANGYSAIHTTLHLPRNASSLGSLQGVEVRLIPYPLRERTTSEIGPGVRHRIGERIARDREHRRITVFTPRLPRECPRGTTALDLAVVLDPVWVTEELTITINGREIDDSLTLLQQGDVVDIRPQIGAIQPLPPGYRTCSIDPDRLEKRWRERARALAEKAGRAYLGEELAAFGVVKLGAVLLDVLVQDVLRCTERSYRDEHGIGTQRRVPWTWSSSDWYRLLGERELGRLDPTIHLAGYSSVADEDVLHLLNALRRRLAWICNFGGSGRFSAQSRLDVTRAHDCALTHGELIAVELEIHPSRWTLILHRGDCTAQGDADQQSWPTILDPSGRLSERQFILLVRSRKGMLAEIGQFFADHDIEIDAVHAQRRPQAQSIVAVRVMDIPDGDSRRLCAELLSGVSGVDAVFGPEDRSPIDASLLLPSRAAALPTDDPEPWVVGPVVDRAEAFYGRQGPLAWLQRRFDDLRWDRGCSHVYLTGPLRSGKSSLLARFMSRTVHGLHAKVVGVALEYSYNLGWYAFHDRLAAKLIRELNLYARELTPSVYDLQSPALRCRSMIQDFRLLQPDIPIVMALDEAVAMIDDARESPSELESLVDFVESLADLTRVLVIWVGPGIGDPRWWPDPFIAAAKEWQSKPLRRVDKALVRDILEARNVQALRIAASTAVIDRVWRWTQGDIALTVAFAQQLLENSPTRLEDVVVYSLDEVSYAVPNVVIQSALFASRLCLGRRGDEYTVDRYRVYQVIGGRWSYQRAAFLAAKGAGLFVISLADISKRTGMSEREIRKFLHAPLWTGGLELTTDGSSVAIIPLVAEYLGTIGASDADDI